MVVDPTTHLHKRMSVDYFVNVQEWCRSQRRGRPQFCHDFEHGQVTLIVDGLPPITDKSEEQASKAAWRLIQRIVKNNSASQLVDGGLDIPFKVLQAVTTILGRLHWTDNIHCCISEGVFTVGLVDKGLVMNVYCDKDNVNVHIFGARCRVFALTDEGEINKVVDFIEKTDEVVL